MKKYFTIILVATLLFGCKKENMQQEVDNEDVIRAATEQLSGKIVLGQHVFISGVSKTRLPEGCPTLFQFSWIDSISKMEIFIGKMKIGSMPFAISMTSHSTIMQLNSWEQEEYPENGWVKLFDSKAEVTTTQGGGSNPISEPNGSVKIKGFYNVNSKEIEMSIDFNMMNVKGEVFRQKVEPFEGNYEKLINLYEEKLAAYKLDNGLSELSENLTTKGIGLLTETITFNTDITINKTSVGRSDLHTSFLWDGSESNDPKGRMAVSLPKTAIGTGQYIAIEGRGRWLDAFTTADKKEFLPTIHTTWTKLKVFDAKISLWQEGESEPVVSINGGVSVFLNTSIVKKEAIIVIDDEKLKLYGVSGKTSL